MNIISNFFSWLFYELSRFVYLLAKIAYELFNSLASFTLVNPKDAQTILTKVEMIVVIIMFFVIAFNLLNYIIDPDKAKDKKSGTSTLIKDIVLALVILVMINPVFVTLYSFQDTVIKSGIIFNVFNIGSSGSIDEINNDKYTELHNNNQCVYDKSEKSISECEMVYSVNKMIAIVYASFIERTDGADSDYLECDGKDDAYCTAYNNVLMTGKIDSLHELTKTADYAYMACAIPSFIAGLVLAFFLFSFCFNLAIRAAKLGMLQIIAPVPVVMAILPGKSDLRNTWIKEVSKTFVEIFFYLIIIAVVIMLIGLAPGTIKSLFTNGASNIFMKAVALIIVFFGLLTFGKEAPKLLFDLLGIKSTGMISAAAKRAIHLPTTVKNFTGATASVAGSSLSTGIKNARATYKHSQGVGSGKYTAGLAAVGSAIAGSTSVLGRNAISNIKAKDLATVRRNIANNERTVFQKRDERDRVYNEHYNSGPNPSNSFIDRNLNVLTARGQKLDEKITRGVNSFLGSESPVEQKIKNEEYSSKIKGIMSSVKGIYEKDEYKEIKKKLNQLKNLNSPTDDDKINIARYEQMLKNMEEASFEEKLTDYKNAAVDMEMAIRNDLASSSAIDNEMQVTLASKFSAEKESILASNYSDREKSSKLFDLMNKYSDNVKDYKKKLDGDEQYRIDKEKYLAQNNDKK